MEDDFFVTLSSSDEHSNKLFTNSPSSFTNQLADRLKIGSEWECGLKQITFPRTWPTIKNRIEFGLIDAVPLKFENDTTYLLKYPCYLEQSVFVDTGDLIDNVNAAMDKADIPSHLHGKYVQISEHPKINLENDKVLIEPGHMWYPLLNNVMRGVLLAPEFGPELSAILGLPTLPCGKGTDRTYMHPSRDHNQDALNLRNPINLDGLFGNLYVYLDCIKYSMIGNIHAPLLRIIDCGSDSKYGITVTQTFHDPYYIKVASTDFDQLQVLIRDREGEEVSFLHGDVTLVLHFRHASSA
jgi:hypothetical protein